MHYFAYGSNMLTVRLRERIGSARVHGVGLITGHELRFHKLSEDGSGKCDIHETGSATHLVHGVVFEIEAEEKRRLDRFEGLGKGYGEKQVEVSLNSGLIVEAVAYCATRRDGSVRPYSWYHALVVAGAREHRLPTTYIEEIEMVSCVEDPEPQRTSRHLRLVRR